MQREYGNATQMQSPAVARQPISMDVLRMAETVASNAQRLADQVLGKLQPVMSQAVPRPTATLDKDGREYPPLFVDLRNNLQSIETALQSIADSIERTEL